MGRAPFSETDPFDVLADGFRIQVAEMGLSALTKSQAYQALPPHRQLECFMAGVITGLVGVCFSHIAPEGRDEMMKGIAAYLPAARENVEQMREPSPGDQQ